MTRFNDVKLQVEAVELLRVLKSGRTYAKLESITGLSPADLSRYINGKVLPGPDRAREIIKRVGEDFVIQEIKRRIVRDEGNYIDHSRFVFSTSMLRRVSPMVGAIFEGKPDVVLTAAADGIPIATHIADFYDVDCAYAKKEKETGVRRFVESSLVTDSGRTVTYYLPAGAVSTGQKVLVVDDLMRTGHTQRILSNLVKEAGGELFAIFTVFSFGRAVERLKGDFECPVKTLIEFE